MNLQKPAATETEIHELLANRWSPRAFDTTHHLSDEEVISLLEAARWAPSGNNSQPWRFIVARRGEPTFDVIAANLAGFNAVWAPRASALVVGLIQPDDANGKPRRTAQYDLGLAIANLSTQATALGLSTHQMGGFDRDKLVLALSIPEDLKPFILVAVGKQAAADSLEEELANRERAPRTRMELSDIVLSGLPN